MHCFDFLPLLSFLVCGSGTQEEEEPQGEPRCPKLEQKTTSGRVYFVQHRLCWAAVADSRDHSVQMLCRLQRKVCLFQMTGKMTRNVTGDVFQAWHLDGLVMVRKIASSFFYWLQFLRNKYLCWSRWKWRNFKFSNTRLSSVAIYWSRFDYLEKCYLDAFAGFFILVLVYSCWKCWSYLLNNKSSYELI